MKLVLVGAAHRAGAAAWDGGRRLPKKGGRAGLGGGASAAAGGGAAGRGGLSSALGQQVPRTAKHRGGFWLRVNFVQLALFFLFAPCFSRVLCVIRGATAIFSEPHRAQHSPSFFATLPASVRGGQGLLSKPAFVGLWGCGIHVAFFFLAHLGRVSPYTKKECPFDLCHRWRV